MVTQQQQQPSTNVWDNESSDSIDETEEIKGDFSRVIDKIKKNITVQISRLEEHFHRAILELRLMIEDLPKQKKILRKNVMNMKTKWKIVKKCNLCSPSIYEKIKCSKMNKNQ